MASRTREDPLIIIHCESSKEHHVGTTTCLTIIFERVIKAVPPPFRPDQCKYSFHRGIFIREPRLRNCQDVKFIVIYVIDKARCFIPYRLSVPYTSFKVTMCNAGILRRGVNMNQISMTNMATTWISNWIPVDRQDSLTTEWIETLIQSVDNLHKYHVFSRYEVSEGH